MSEIHHRSAGRVDDFSLFTMLITLVLTLSLNLYTKIQKNLPQIELTDNWCDQTTSSSVVRSELKSQHNKQTITSQTTATTCTISTAPYFLPELAQRRTWSISRGVKAARWSRQARRCSGREILETWTILVKTLNICISRRTSLQLVVHSTSSLRPCQQQHHHHLILTSSHWPK